MNPNALLTVYCVLVVLASVAGGLAPLLIRLTHRRLQLIISLTTGFMLGVALLLMIPHAVEAVPAESAMLWLLGGFLLMFFIERFLSFHTHEVAEVDAEGVVITTTEDLAQHDHTRDACHHDHAHPHTMAGNTPGTKISWVGAAAGMAIHSVIDGVALAAAVLGAHHFGGASSTALAGVAVFIVVLLHKPLDSLTVIALTASSGFDRPARHLINFALATMVPVGVLAFVLGVGGTLGHGSPVIGYAMAFSAGTFLCIALSDLLPELQFHDHDRVKLSVGLLLGVAIAVGVSQMEHRLHDHGGHDHAAHAGGGDSAEDLPVDPHAGHDHGDGHDDHVSTPPANPHAGHDHADRRGHDH